MNVGEATITEHTRAIAAQLGAVTTAGDDFLPERHEIVFDESPAADGADGEDLIQRLIYRADEPYRREYSAIRYPAELNRRPGWLAAVGPYVSVVCGHPDFITNSIFISAVQAVAAAAQLRAIRQAAYDNVRQFRGFEAADDNRRLRYAAAIGFVSAAAIPIGLIFAFLSTSTPQVNKAWSMFSHHYLGAYLCVAAIIVIGAVLWLGLLLQQRRDAREHTPATRRPPWAPTPDDIST